jgi:hypothetical protein
MDEEIADEVCPADVAASDVLDIVYPRMTLITYFSLAPEYQIQGIKSAACS